MHRVARSTVRVLGLADLAEAAELCAVEPYLNAFVASRLSSGVVGPGRPSEVWGFYDGGALTALCWNGGNLVPVGAVDDDIADAFASRAARIGRRCSSIFGPAPGVLALWQRLRPAWGAAREVRADQPLMVCGNPLVSPDPRVRPATRDDFALLLPASVAMFTEEIGFSPVAGDGARVYRSGVEELIDNGRSFVRIDVDLGGPELVFKADLGAVTSAVAQIQGVWVAPHRRGHGISAPAVAGVVTTVLREIAPAASLYVNAYNTRAIRTYERVGFRRVARYATVLF